MRRITSVQSPVVHSRLIQSLRVLLGLLLRMARQVLARSTSCQHTLSNVAKLWLLGCHRCVILILAILSASILCYHEVFEASE